VSLQLLLVAVLLLPVGVLPLPLLLVDGVL
jgi:hypothetical protein